MVCHVQYQQRFPFLPDHFFMHTARIHFRLGGTAVCGSHSVKQYKESI